MVMEPVVELELEVVVDGHEAHVDFQQRPDLGLGLRTVYEAQNLHVGESMNQTEDKGGSDELYEHDRILVEKLQSTCGHKYYGEQSQQAA